MAVYRYQYKIYGQLLKSWVAAPDLGSARMLLAAARIDYIKIQLDPVCTLDEKFRPGTVNWLELLKLYKAMVRGQESGNMIEMVNGAGEFLTNWRVTTSAAKLKSGLQGGYSVAESMAASGFPAQHVELVRASTSGGQVASALKSLVADCDRRAMVAGKLQEAISKPAVTALFILGLVFSLSVFYLPEMGPVLKNNIDKLEEPGRQSLSRFVLGSVDFSLWIGSNKLLFTGLYWGTLVSIILALTQSRWVQRQLLRIPSYRIIREMSEMATIWPMYALLKTKSVSATDVTQILAKTCSMPEAAEWFSRMTQALRSGASDGEAATRAGMPVYVISAINLGARRSELLEELTDQAKEWIDTVNRTVGSFGGKLEIAAWVVLGSLVVLLAMVMLYPRFAIQLAALL